MIEGQLVIWAGLALGLGMGFVAQRTQFCPVGAISDMVLIGDTRRIRAWAMAMAVALATLEALRLAELARPASSVYILAPNGLIGSVLGGFLIGAGMVLTGGGVVRLAVRMGAGSGKALVTLLAVALAGGVTLFGWGGELLGEARNTLPDWLAPISGHSIQAIPELLAEWFSIDNPWQMRAGFAIGLSLLIGLWALEDMWFRRSPIDLLGGLAIGLIIALAWAANPSENGGEGVRILPALGLLAGSSIGGIGSVPGFAIAFLAGLILGGSLGALFHGGVRAEIFANQPDLWRNLAGGFLIGTGGALAGACEIGIGLSGISALAPSAMFALAAMFTGARVTLYILERRIA